MLARPNHVRHAMPNRLPLRKEAACKPPTTSVPFSILSRPSSSILLLSLSLSLSIFISTPFHMRLPHGQPRPRIPPPYDQLIRQHRVEVAPHPHHGIEIIHPETRPVHARLEFHPDEAAAQQIVLDPELVFLLVASCRLLGVFGLFPLLFLFFFHGQVEVVADGVVPRFRLHPPHGLEAGALGSFVHAAGFLGGGDQRRDLEAGVEDGSDFNAMVCGLNPVLFKHLLRRQRSEGYVERLAGRLGAQGNVRIHACGPCLVAHVETLIHAAKDFGASAVEVAWQEHVDLSDLPELLFG